VELRSKFIFGALAMAAFCLCWENCLRTMLPARKPPTRGYLAHTAELAQARMAAQSVKKRD